MRSEERDARRRWAREAAIVLVLMIAGIVFAVFSSGYTALEGIAIGCFGIAGVAGTSFVFYEVGRSEDLDRARGGRGPYDRAPGPVVTDEPMPDDRPHEGGHAHPAQRPRRRPPRRGGHRAR